MGPEPGGQGLFLLRGLAPHVHEVLLCGRDPVPGGVAG